MSKLGFYDEFSYFCALQININDMWQRVQTLYLGIATVLIASMFFCNFAVIPGNEGSESTIGYGEYLAYLLFLLMLVTANVIALGTFKARMLQMRICILASILLLAFQIWLGVDMVRNREEMTFSFTAVFPAIAMILDLMAARNIFLDEAMVRAASHLRGARKRHGRQDGLR